jgi:hypothetical protein
MDKNNIKKQLVERFVNEATPGIDVTKAVLTKSKAFNDEGLKDIEKKLKDAEKGQKKSQSKTKDMPQNKFNYNDDSEKEYHQEMEIMNGQEMIEYDRQPNQIFKERAIEAIEGSTRMGNSPEYANVVPEQMGFTGPTFGKKLVQAIKDSAKKRQDAVKGIISFGDDIETVSKNYAPMSKFSALAESEDKDKKDDPDDMEQADASGDDYEKASREIERENKTNNKPQIKEGMKRLKFKQEFKGVGNALKLIPESYRVDNKTFEMTDGIESYRMRWEGTLTEGRAVVLTASDKTMINEDMQKMKHLMGYKSQDTLGTVKGKARINENAIFSDIWKKSIVLIEGENIETQKAPVKKTDEKVSQAGEAKKHVKGSSTTDKGTKAPAAKTGSADSLEKVKKQAPEAKKAVQGSVEKKVGIGLGDQSEGEGEWDQIDVPQAAAHGNPSKTTYAQKPATGDWDKAKPAHAADAKKHVHMREGIQLGENYFAPMDENMFDEGMYEEGMYEEGMYDEGMYDEGMYDEGMYDEGMYEEDSKKKGLKAKIKKVGDYINKKIEPIIDLGSEKIDQAGLRSPFGKTKPFGENYMEEEDMGNDFYRTDAEDQISNPPSEINIPMDEEMDEMYSFEEEEDESYMPEMDSLMEGEEDDDDDDYEDEDDNDE